MGALYIELTLNLHWPTAETLLNSFYVSGLFRILRKIFFIFSHLNEIMSKKPKLISTVDRATEFSGGVLSDGGVLFCKFC